MKKIIRCRQIVDASTDLSGGSVALTFRGVELFSGLFYHFVGKTVNSLESGLDYQSFRHFVFI